jgi:Na+/H+ antiporter NhaD/arsenite permease-like protein
MAIPTLFSGILLISLCYLVFKAQVSKTFVISGNRSDVSGQDEIELGDSVAIQEASSEHDYVDWRSAYFGSAILFTCLGCLAFSPLINLPLHVITSFFALVYLIRNLFYYGCSKSGHNSITFFTALKGLPWAVIPFVLSMFILLEALDIWGLIADLADVFVSMSTNSFTAVLTMIFASVVAAQFLNNQPMTILFTKILIEAQDRLPYSTTRLSYYTLILGSNVAANFTFVGALAGVMWVGLLRQKGVPMSSLTFFKYGFITMLPVSMLFILILFIQSAIAS